MSKHSLSPETWVDTYGNLLLGYAAQRVPERDVARDLVQETFLTAIRTKDTFRGEISEKNWLFLVLKSRILDHFKKKKETLASDIGREENEDDPFDEKGHWLGDRLPQEWTTDKMVRNNEFMEVFSKCQDGLKEIQRMVFSMRYLDGYDSETICKELGISSSNYWVLTHRAKLGLRECIEKKWFEQ